MTLEQIYLISSSGAAIAVVASLVFVGFQVRQSNRMMREATVRHHVEGVTCIGKALFEVPGLADIWDRGGKDLNALTAAERVAFVNFYVYALRLWELLHLQREFGSMDEALWNANVRILKDAHQLPGARVAWEIRRHIFTPRFQAFYESYVSEGPAKPLYGEQTRSAN